MKATLGRGAFYVLYPVIWLVLRGTVRPRIMVVCNDEVLLVKNALSRGLWSLPGGGKHKSETAAQAVIRELREETGVLLAEEELVSLPEVAHNRKTRPYQIPLFGVQLQSKPKIQPSYEIIAVQWFTISALPEALSDHTKRVIEAYHSNFVTDEKLLK